MPLLSHWIIEDEPPALRRLSRLINQLRPDFTLSFTSDSVSETVAALSSQPLPDLIFSDIQLADGRAFEIWEQAKVKVPIIFTTAYDQYSIRAFRVNSIDYLLKPVEQTALERAITKAENLNKSTVDFDIASIAAMIGRNDPVYRERFLVQHRQEWIPLKTNELRQIFSSDGLTFALHQNGSRYLLDDPLDRIENDLDPKRWFRINRSQIIHVDSVRKVSPYFNHRLVMDLSPAGELDNIVSRSRVKACRSWLGR